MSRWPSSPIGHDCRSHSQAVCCSIVRRGWPGRGSPRSTRRKASIPCDFGMKPDQEQTLSRASIFVVTVAAALTTPWLAANNAYSAAGVVSQAEPTADQSVPKEAQSKSRYRKRRSNPAGTSLEISVSPNQAVTFSIRSHEYRRSPRALAPGIRISGVRLADAKIIGATHRRAF